MSEMITDSLELTLRPSKKPWLSACLVSFVFSAAGLLMISDGKPMGWYVMSFFTITMIIFITHFSTSYIKLQKKSFTVKNLFKSSIFFWSQVGDFRVLNFVVDEKIVFLYNFETGVPYQGNLTISKVEEVVLPDTYGFKPQDLIELMRKYKNMSSC